MQSREMLPEGLERGLDLLQARRNEIEPHEGSYTVPDGDERYVVAAGTGGTIACSCGAVCGPSEARGTVCSHMWAARLYHAERVAENEAETALIDTGGRGR